ncbi:hypothetical protein [Lentzea sp. NPDC051838]|uniref:hypothetical protein n=1 Tax=Lentzea sp. NPDC051838 TaxID=3154849 RepID=UPI0034281757
MVDFHQLRTWHADEVHDVVRRLLTADVTSNDIARAWGLAFDLSGATSVRSADHDLAEVEEVLALAAAQVPPGACSDAGLTGFDVEEYLEHTEWELALDVLGDFEGITWQTPRYWDLLAGAAVQMDLDPAWFHWRRGESIHGLLRAELTLDPAAEGVRFQGTRPVWDLSGGERRVAAMWVEKQTLEPGERATVRLRPLLPSAWTHLARGDLITYQQFGESMGTAKIVEKVPPRP